MFQYYFRGGLGIRMINQIIKVHGYMKINLIFPAGASNQYR